MMSICLFFPLLLPPRKCSREYSGAGRAAVLAVVCPGPTEQSSWLGSGVAEVAYSRASWRGYIGRLVEQRSILKMWELGFSERCCTSRVEVVDRKLRR